MAACLGVGRDSGRGVEMARRVGGRVGQRLAVQDSCTVRESVQSNRSPVMCTALPGAPLAGSSARAAGAVSPTVSLVTVKD